MATRTCGLTAMFNSFVYNMSIDYYIVNMKKDYGRYSNSLNLKALLNATIWEGIDPAECDTNGYLIKTADSRTATASAKKAKLNLFLQFMKNKTPDYLGLFEDDVFLHKKFPDELKRVEQFVLKNSPSLFYFGVSNNRKFTMQNDISIELLDNQNKKAPCPGAYGVIINRKIVPYLISYIRDPGNKMAPFDMTCLGVIQLMHPHKCYITNPPLLVPDITTSNIRQDYDQNIYYKNANVNPEYYTFPKHNQLFINLTNLSDKQIVRHLYKAFEPQYKLIFTNDIDTVQKTGDYYICVKDVVFRYFDGGKLMDIISDNISQYDELVLFDSDDAFFYVKRVANIRTTINIQFDGLKKYISQ